MQKMVQYVNNILVTGLLAGFLTMRLAKAEGEPSEPVSFSEAMNNFTMTLLQEQFKLTDDNVIMSPNSIGTLLSILQSGAQGDTLTQLSEALRMTLDEAQKGFKAEIESLMGEKKEVTLKSGSRLYLRPGFELTDTFNETINRIYGASIEEIDFVNPSLEEAVKKINTWVGEATNDHIKNLLSASDFTPDTAFVVLNAIYFKGLWDVPFKKALTRADKFETGPENSVEVPFMAQKERFIAGEDLETGLQWIDLPFKDEQFSMLFILPREKHGLSKVLEKLDGSLLGQIIQDEQTRQVTMLIPKFKLTQNVPVGGLLKNMGVTDMFTSKADFQGITPTFRHLAVSKVFHQASVEIDEDGSTASAASGISSEILAFPKSSDFLEFKADHPFLFFIIDRTNKVPLFAGKIVNPSKPIQTPAPKRF